MLLLGVVQAQKQGAVAAGSYDLLATEILTSSQASVTFSGLSAYATDYQHLQIRYTGRTVESANAITGNYIRFNGDSGLNYALHFLYGNGSSVLSSSETSSTATWLLAGLLTKANVTSGAYAAGVIDILDPFSASKNKTVRTLTGVASSINRIDLHSGFWMNTNAVSSIQLTQNGSSYAIGSRFSLYGIKAA